jgi:serine/threonine protein kinase
LYIVDFIFSIVYKARCKENNQLVALKAVLSNGKEGFPIATLAEMQLQQNLKHVNIVKLLGICESSGRLDFTRNKYI